MDDLSDFYPQVIERLDLIVSLLRQMASGQATPVDAIESEYTVAEPIRLIVANSPEGRFLQQKVDDRYVPLDWPVNPDGTQSIAGRLKGLDVIRAIAGDRTRKSSGLTHTPRLVMTIATSPRTEYRLDVGDVKTVAARMVMGAIANASRSILDRPIKVTFSSGDATYLAALKDVEGNTISCAGSSASGLDADGERKLIADLISASVQKVHDAFLAKSAIAIYQAIQENRDPSEDLNLLFLPLYRDLLALQSIDQIKARLGQARTELEADKKPEVMTQLKALHAYHTGRLAANDA